MDYKEGYLVMNESERYELRSKYDEYLTYFTSGDNLEVYFEEEGWIRGRMEHRDDLGGYYLYIDNNTHRELYNGLKARSE